MKILYLTLKARWYDLIAEGIKTEEYREMTYYWTKRLKYENDGAAERKTGYAAMIFRHEFTHVRFARGGHFASFIPQMTFELDDINIAAGKPDWGAEAGKKYFVITLGKMVEKGIGNSMNDLTQQQIF